MDSLTIKIASDLEIDVLKVVKGRMAICSNSGGGKSHALRLLVEKVAGKIPVHIIDPEGEYGALRSELDAVLVAENGDIPPVTATAFALAKHLREHQVSAIIDTSSMSTPAEPLSFVANYIQGLLASPRSSWRPTLVIVDEAHRFAPEVVSGGGKRDELDAGHAARSAVIRLMDAGRKRRLGVVLTTQRIAKIAKSALGECNNVLMGRFAQDADLSRVTKSLGIRGTAVWNEIKAFDDGEFYAQGRAMNVVGTRKIRTFEQTKTKAPEDGGEIAVSRPSASVRRILGDLAALAPAEESEEVKRSTPAQLIGAVSNEGARMVAAERKRWRHEIHMALLRVQTEVEHLAHAPIAAVPGAIEEIAAWCATESNRLTGKASNDPPAVDDALEPAPERKPKARARRTRLELAPTPAPAPEPRQPRRRAPSRRQATPSNGHQKLPFAWSAVPGRILTVLIQYEGNDVEPRRVAALAGVRFAHSTWRNSLSVLRKHSLVKDGLAGGALAASSTAIENYAWAVEPLPSGADMIGGWKRRLGGVPLRIFEYLLVPHGSEGAERESIAADLGITSPSTLRNALSLLRRNGLIVDSRHGGRIRLADHVITAKEASRGRRN